MNWRCAAVSLLCAAAPASAQQLARGPYLVDASSVSAQVCWRGSSRDDYCRRVERIPGGAAFKYGVPGARSEWLAKTLSRADQKTRFAVVGDLGDGPAQQRVAAALEAASAQFALLTGDVAFPDGSEADYAARYFPVYAKTIASIAFFPAVGDVDYGDAWLASRGERRFYEGYARAFKKSKYYSFDSGPVHFVSIDTNQAYHVGGAEPLELGSPQLRWLDRDLRESRAPWKIVFMHVPLYSTRRRHGDNAWLRAQLQPIFSRRGVDLAFAGHENVYQRSKLLNGTVYVTVGTGGAPLARPSRGADWLDKEVVAHGLAVVEADTASLSLVFYDDNGQPRDAVTMPKIGAPPPGE